MPMLVHDCLKNRLPMIVDACVVCEIPDFPVYKCQKSQITVIDNQAIVLYDTRKTLRFLFTAAIAIIFATAIVLLQ